MKELSIEEKAKRYDEAIKRIENIKTGKCETTFMFTEGLFEHIFPELKESEDERIRKNIKIALMSMEDNLVDFYSTHRTSQKELLAWLEKQGNEPNWCHHKVDLSNCSEEYRKAYYDGWNNCNMQHSQCKSDGNDVVKCLINGMKFYYDDNKEASWGTEKFSMKVKDILSWLEKQGEQKSIDNLTPQEAMDIAVAKCFEQGEQKSADKVEPKFKVGDWVINTITKEVEQVIELTDCEYICSGHLIVSFNNQHLLRRWTIQDAKDGDVLYLQKDGKEHIIIYKGVIKERFRTFVSAYCAYNGIVDAFCFADVSRYVDIAYGGIMPATKEQRDLLFQKMHEAGYEWDAKKKELKKIEQNSAWSAEDEKILNLIIARLHSHPNVEAEEYGKDYHWLKFLKERIKGE